MPRLPLTRIYFIRMLYVGIFRRTTILFRKDGAAPKLKNMLLGRRVIGEMLIERIPMESVPEDPIKAANWLHQLYRHKVSIHEGLGIEETGKL